MLIDWVGDVPAESEIFNHIKQMFGTIGVVESRFFAKEGLIGCETEWVERIRGALALKWQFKVKKISGTKKKARV